LKNKILKKITKEEKYWKNRYKSDCLTQVVAFYFNIHADRIPFFIEYTNWKSRLKSFFKRRGKKITWIKYDKKLRLNKNKLYIVQGQSPRSKKWQHAVIYKGHKPFYDSSSDRKFIKGKPKWIYIIK